MKLSKDLYLAEDSGELKSQLHLPENRSIQSMQWLQDGKRILAHTSVSFETWNAVLPMLPEDERRLIENYKPLVVPNLKVALSAMKAEEGMDVLINRLHEKNVSLFLLALKCYQDLDSESFQKELVQLPRAAEFQSWLRNANLKYLLNQFVIFELEGTKLTEKNVLKTTLLSSFKNFQINRSGSKLAWIQTSQLEKEVGELVLLDIELNRMMVLAKDASGALAWSHQDDSIIFTRAPHYSGGMLQMIQKSSTQVTDSNPEQKVLATTLVGSMPMIQVLPDNRILFAGFPATFPLSGEEFEFESQFYVLDPKDLKMQRVNTDKGALPLDLSFFVASPDGKRVAMVERSSDVVAVLELESGKVHKISPSRGYECRTLPVWKSTEELTFAAYQPDTKRIECLLWNVSGKVEVLSSSWNHEAMRDWLSQPKN